MTTSSSVSVNGEKMPRWYYQRRELRQSPSVLKGMDSAIEARYRREGARFIIELGTSMNLSLSTTMATAVVFYHRFYMCHSFQEFPRYPTACACLFLAGKVEETPKKCRDMIESARRLLEEPKFSQQFGAEEKNRLEELMTLERILLQTIKFDLQLEHPYKFLLKYATLIKGEKNRLEKMVQMAWNFVNDSLCTTLCLQWEPEIIAIALMYLACKLSKFEVTDWTGRTNDHLRWWDMFVEDMTIDVLEDICHQVLDFYSTAQGLAPPALSEPTAGISTPTPLNPSNASASQPPLPNSNSRQLPPPGSAIMIQTPGTGFNYPPQMFQQVPPVTSLPPSYSSSVPSKINPGYVMGGPPPFFTHQPPPPILLNSPQPPLPQLPPPPSSENSPSLPPQPPPPPM